ncbi:hypothetical protein [Nocardia sp. BMG51109]|uniref:hypothetical protein n=1 Tax=Nocardia sp. BMG51109 TaxID=1056816 RepID=UPI0018DE7146|nr:hypothetical protein [Nocardia sp. BMG51109]
MPDATDTGEDPRIPAPRPRSRTLPTGVAGMRGVRPEEPTAGGDRHANPGRAAT